MNPTNDPATPKTSALAIWSLVLGILAFLCFSIFSAIPAVICGHKALSRIKSSGGAITGQGLAIGGLVTGYCNIALSVDSSDDGYCGAELRQGPADGTKDGMCQQSATD